MTVIALLLVGLVSAQGNPLDDLAEELDQIARVATVMVDGDLCSRIPTQEAMSFILQEHPRRSGATARSSRSARGG